MDYRELLAQLFAARRGGIVWGLDRVRAVLDRLGAPDRALGRVVHVGGTNGKGSTVAMIGALAAATGARVARYTSPHLTTVRERIVIDGELITEEAFLAAAERVHGAGGGELTFFEQLTAIGIDAIARARPDVTVLEVGLGGRLDATNTVAAPVAVVTGVAMDHEAMLGDTLALIAREKAGIFKRGQHVIVGASGEPEAVAWLVDAARAAGAASVTAIDDAAIACVPALALAGAHQRSNAAAALAAVTALGLPVHAAALAAVTVPGRFEQVGDVILDGAHNPHGARALATVLRERGLRPVLVIAVSADKDARAIAGALAPEARAVIATRYQQDRALDPAALAGHFAGAHTAPDLASALAIARTLGGPILIAGSLFLVGEARALLLGAPIDPIAVSDPAVVRGQPP